MSPDRTVVIDGNTAAAWGARLARARIIPFYPITPHSPMMEALARFVADGEMEAVVIPAESEHTVMSILQGAAMAGSRTFSGTSASGLSFMQEAYIWTPGMRLPIVMTIANREIEAPGTVGTGQQDAISVRDAGWLQIFVENNQEILDSILMAYRIAEHPNVLLPVNVCYDGLFLSHLIEAVRLPSQDDVDRFLPPYEATGLRMEPEKPQSFSPGQPGNMLMEYRFKQTLATQRAKTVINQVDEEFGLVFGRRYGGLVSEYRLEDAELALVTLGSVTGTARVAADIARDKGARVGLLKLRSLRPFPREVLCQKLQNKKAVGVISRDVCFGWGSGTVFMELRAALRDINRAPITLSFIDGLGGADITLPHLLRALDLVEQAASGKPVPEVNWLGVELI
ncbi:MAG: phenylglyoxylate dehydrogenase [Chloroflexota bacterium]